MAALLRQGARRIGGSVLQRSQAAITSPAVAGQRRHLLPRRMTTDEHPRDAMQEAQQKKEELYEVLSKMGKMRDRGLLQDLAAQINPRPQDTQWRAFRVARRIGNFVDATGTALFVTLVVVVNGVYGSYYAAVERHAAMEMQDQAKKQVAMERENKVETLMENQ